jgi:Ca-activated chloride channel family protein
LRKWILYVSLIGCFALFSGCHKAGPDAPSGEDGGTSADLAEVAADDAADARVYQIAPGYSQRAKSEIASNPAEMLFDAEYGADPAMAPPVPAQPPGDGVGPGRGGDKFDRIVENDFVAVANDPRSTFSIDVDTASYSKVRSYLMENNRLPPPDSVRIEELINYFVYDYQGPSGEHPFAAHVEVAECPWKPQHRLVRIGIKGQEIEQEQRPPSNLVFLLDVSGSMDQANKLPLLKRGMKMLVDQLSENDRVAIVVYASAAGLVLDSTTCDDKQTVLDALQRLSAGGSTNGGQGIRLAYRIALDNFIQGGTNRVLLCTDGDFNVGTTSPGEIVRLAEENAKAGVFLSVLGFGIGNHHDSLLEQVSNKADGNYAFIDNDLEARKVLVEQMSGTLVTIAKDVKIQIEFNPAEVSAFRLIGYENRVLAHRDFNDDTKDAGEIGAGHTVTALYEIVPVGIETGVDVPAVDDLKYQQEKEPAEAAASGELLTLKLRYKLPDGDTSTLMSIPVMDNGKRIGQSSVDFQQAAAVALFGMLLRDSKYKGDAGYDAALEIAGSAAANDTSGYRAQFLEMVGRAKELTGGR